MNKQDVINLLYEKISEFGTVVALANDMGVDATYISMVLHGKRNPPQIMLDYLGLEKKINYVRKEDE